MARNTEWGSVCCQSERDFTAINSWFGRLLPESWGKPLKADILTHITTDREKAIRALYRLPNGRLKEARVNFTTRGRTMKFTDATPGILADPFIKAFLARDEAA